MEAVLPPPQPASASATPTAGDADDGEEVWTCRDSGGRAGIAHQGTLVAVPAYAGASATAQSCANASLDSGDGGGVRRTRARGGRVVAAVAGLAIRGITDGEALRDAKQLTRVTALSAVEPDLTDRSLTGDPAALARLDRTVRTRVLRSPVVRVKLWTLDGRIVYSDARPLIGRRFALDPGERRARADRRASTADLSDAGEPENVFERGLGKLLEVYLPVRTPDGHPLLYEEYLRYGAIAGQQPPPVARAGARVRRRAPRPRARPAAARVVARAAPAAARAGARGAAHPARRVIRPRAPAAGAGAARRAGAGARRAGVAPRARPRGGRAPPLAGELEEGAADAARRAARAARAAGHAAPAQPAPRRPPGRADRHRRAAAGRRRRRASSTSRPTSTCARRRGARLPRRRGGAAERPAARGREPRRGRPAPRRRASAPARPRRRRAASAPTSSRTGTPAVIAGSRCLRDLAADAGGELTVDSAPGRGTTLELDAPGRDPRPHRRRPPARARGSRTAARRARRHHASSAPPTAATRPSAWPPSASPTSC